MKMEYALFITSSYMVSSYPSDTAPASSMIFCTYSSMKSYVLNMYTTRHGANMRVEINHYSLKRTKMKIEVVNAMITLKV